MIDLTSRSLKGEARQTLSGYGKTPRQVALLYAAVSVGAALLVTVLQYFLDQGISSTGGLAGLDTRSYLSTLQTLLQYAINIALPFWSVGFVFVAMQIARKQQTGYRDMTMGFRRFGPILRLYLLQSLLYIGVMIVCVYAGSFLVAFTPWSVPLMNIALEAGGSVEAMEAALMAMPAEELMALMLPMLILSLVLFGIVYLFLSYRFRMAPYLLIDQPRMGAMAAMIISGRMTRYRRWKLLKLDLSFWWFYLLQLLCAAAMYLDVLLRFLVPDLPVSAEAAWLLAYLLGSLLQMALFWRCSAYVQTTYALAYERIRVSPPAQPKSQQVPQNLPWDPYQTQQ